MQLHMSNEASGTYLGVFGIWGGVFGIRDDIFGSWDNVFGIWDGVFGVWDGLFGISRIWCLVFPMTYLVFWPVYFM